MSNKSLIDPARKTVGAIYTEAAEKNTDEYVEAGDLSRELTKSFVDDLNDTIKSKPFDDRPFYILVYEKKDLQMKRAIVRRLYVMEHRPYPEDDSVVFHVDPKSNTLKFCWCLPHYSEMDNVILNPVGYEKEYIEDIKAYKENNLKHFGFEEVKTLASYDKKNKKILNISEFIDDGTHKPVKIDAPIPSKENRDRVISKV